jgi:hypothetical protein
MVPNKEGSPVDGPSLFLFTQNIISYLTGKTMMTMLLRVYFHN